MMNDTLPTAIQHLRRSNRSLYLRHPHPPPASSITIRLLLPPSPSAFSVFMFSSVARGDNVERPYDKGSSSYSKIKADDNDTILVSKPFLSLVSNLAGDATQILPEM
ncbi:hypothetical protein L6452_03832 [Arctium lappa]|uniref:Uncharacterized protein n=1 Tax=Arctium lappa TaxID=4217 RepID=A0ACB9FNG9_ARCLA|nr:hypothetical protein L6452_03832 [Arctium lappa]